MKSFIVVEDHAGLQFAALNGMEFAFPNDNKELHASVAEVIRDGYSYRGGAIIDICGKEYKYMYL